MRRRWVAATAWVCAVVVAAGAGVWAGRATFSPPQVPAESQAATVYTVTEGTVGRSMSFPVAARWADTPLATGAAEGTITSMIVQPGTTVSAGDVLYSVDLRPVTIAQGDYPAFRDLSEGSEGADVRQLKTFLAAKGYLTGTQDAKFTAATTSAVKRWQKAVGVAVDGTVQAGDLVYATALPTRVTLSADVVVGAVITPGTPVASALAAAPDFVVTLAAEQAQLVPTSGPVKVQANDVVWDAVISSATTDADGLHLALTAPDGGPVCGADCALVPITAGAAIYTAQIVVVPDATGPVVPAAAVGVAADGSTYVRGEDGTSIPVTVQASGDGRAVVSGIAVGDRVALFSDTVATTATPEPR